MEKISIICPVYNAVKYLPSLINSINGQTYNSFECILIYDVSNDGSLSFLKTIKDPRFRVIVNNQNKGAQECRKIGFNAASGEYTCFIDSDDKLDREYLMKLYTKIKKDNSDIVMCHYGIVDQNDKVIRVNENITPIDKEKFPLTSRYNKEVILSKPAFWNKMFKSSFLKENLHFPKVRLGQDLVIMPILFSKANLISYVDECLYYYRLHQSSMSNQIDLRILDIKKVFSYLDANLDSKYDEELEYLALSHYYFQISKVLMFNNYSDRGKYSIELKQSLNDKFPNYMNNKYLQERKSVMFFIKILDSKIMYKNKVLNKGISLALKNKYIFKVIRKFDR